VRRLIEEIIYAIEGSGELPLAVAIQLNTPGVLRKTWRHATRLQRIRWVRARPGGLEPLAWEVARIMGFSSAIVEEARATIHDIGRFAELGGKRKSEATLSDPRDAHHGWWAIGRVFDTSLASLHDERRATEDLVISLGAARIDMKQVDAILNAIGPPTLEETVAYAARLLPGNRR
jgi:hypothetical protein